MKNYIISFLVSVLVSNIIVKGQSNNNFIKVDKVWSGHPVDFDIITTDAFQYVIYYNSDRQVEIAQRKMDSPNWKKNTLPSVTGWDSHNYLTVEIDEKGYLHISGNMHGDTLVYFRSVKPESIEGFEKLAMTEHLENEVTYPVFFKNKKGDLFFQYRDGISGNGITLWNSYDVGSKSWSRVFEGGLFDGEQEANAYPVGPVPGPNGYFHMVWMWRLTPNANTNHNLSYMRSKDLERWENIKGEIIDIPVKWSDNRVTVDQVGPWNGLINMDFNIWFDSKKNPLITYHKYDKLGISQIYCARIKEKMCKIHQLSRWKDYSWNLNKYGSIEAEVRFTKLGFTGEGKLQGQYFHKNAGKGVWIINENSLEVISTEEDMDITIPQKVVELPLVGDGYQKNYILDNTGEYLLVWQTLQRNQDRERKGPFPEPTLLFVYKMNE